MHILTPPYHGALRRKVRAGARSRGHETPANRGDRLERSNRMWTRVPVWCALAVPLCCNTRRDRDGVAEHIARKRKDKALREWLRRWWSVIERSSSGSPVKLGQIPRSRRPPAKRRRGAARSDGDDRRQAGHGDFAQPALSDRVALSAGTVWPAGYLWDNRRGVTYSQASWTRNPARVPNSGGAALNALGHTVRAPELPRQRDHPGSGHGGADPVPDYM